MEEAIREEEKLKAKCDSLKSEIRAKKMEKARTTDYTETEYPWYGLGLIPFDTEVSREDERIVLQNEIDELERDLQDVQAELSEARSVKNRERQRMSEAKRKAS
jgi:DNA repair exonuclease SbcCD ATPase subunit